jgi:hypothetical protein
VPTAVDLPSAIAAINALKLLIQLISGQQGSSGANGFGSSGFSASGGTGTGAQGAPGKDGKKGKDGKDLKSRFVEDRRQRVEKKIRIFQNNDKKSSNWVDIKQINKVVWIDTVTGETIKWSR